MCTGKNLSFVYLTYQRNKFVLTMMIKETSDSKLVDSHGRLLIILKCNLHFTRYFLSTHQILARTSSGSSDPVRIEQAVSAGIIIIHNPSIETV